MNRDDDDMLEFYHRMDMAEQQYGIKQAEKLLQKLSVKELRILGAHYWKCSPRDLADMPKRDLVAEIAPDYAEQMWG